jgi:hypothetical protein
VGSAELGQSHRQEQCHTVPPSNTSAALALMRGQTRQAHWSFELHYATMGRSGLMLGLEVLQAECGAVGQLVSLPLCFSLFMER